MLTGGHRQGPCTQHFRAELVQTPSSADSCKSSRCDTTIQDGGSSSGCWQGLCSPALWSGTPRRRLRSCENSTLSRLHWWEPYKAASSTGSWEEQLTPLHSFIREPSFPLLGLILLAQASPHWAEGASWRTKEGNSPPYFSPVSNSCLPQGNHDPDYFDHLSLLCFIALPHKQKSLNCVGDFCLFLSCFFCQCDVADSCSFKIFTTECHSITWTNSLSVHFRRRRCVFGQDPVWGYYKPHCTILSSIP